MIGVNINIDLYSLVGRGGGGVGYRAPPEIYF